MRLAMMALALLVAGCAGSRSIHAVEDAREDYVACVQARGAAQCEDEKAVLDATTQARRAMLPPSLEVSD